MSQSNPHFHQLVFHFMGLVNSKFSLLGFGSHFNKGVGRRRFTGFDVVGVKAESAGGDVTLVPE